MEKIFKKRRNFEKATSFRLEYCYCTGDEIEPAYRDFKSVKALAQWESRSRDSAWNMVTLKRLALIDETWEPFATIGKKNITLSDLINIVEDLKSSL